MLGKTNACVGEKVNNQDLYITDNGVYTAGEGFTGLGTVDVNVPKGKQITAVNKTGTAITAGSKVWLNENQQTAGTSYNIETYAVGSPDASSGVLSRGGNFAWRNNKIFSINADSATNIGSFSANAGSIRYMSEGSVFLGSSRVDDVAQYALPSKYYLMGDDFVFAGSSGNSKIYQLNMSDGSILNTWTSTNTSTFLSSEGVKVGNYFYRLWNGNQYKCHLSDDGTIVYDGNFTFENPYNGALYPMGVTADNRYILCSNNANYSNSTSQNVLVILEVIDDNTIKQLTPSEAPTDLQPFMVSTNASWGHKFVFNPYTGILTAVTYNSTSYVVMKYENGIWSKLPIELNLGEEPLKGSLTLSDDLTRACIAYGSSGNWYSYILNLETTSGYAAVPYKFYNINEDTITGYAGNDTEPDGEVIVGIANVPSNDTGGDSGGTGEEPSIIYNIDDEKVMLAGNLNLSTNEQGSNTVVSGFSDSSFLLLKDDYGPIPNFGTIGGSADTYCVKFKVNSQPELLQDTVVLGNMQDEQYPNNVISMFGWSDGSFVLDLSGINELPEDPNYSNQFARIGWDSSQLGQWITVELKLNENGYWQFVSDKPTVVDFCYSEIQDRYENKNIAFEIPYYATFGNMNDLAPDLEVDLAETGFKLNGEWVWRAVK